MKWIASTVISILILGLSGARADAAAMRGTVRGADGRPLEGVPVFVWQHGGAFAVVALTGYDGVYDVWVPDFARYNVAANKEGLEGRRDDLPAAGVDNVDTTDGETVVNFDLPGGAPPPPPPPPPPGAYSPDVGLDAEGNRHAAILDAYHRGGGAGALGQPYDNGGSSFVHRWGAGIVQDVQGGARGRGAVMQPDGSGTAFVLVGGAWEAYLAAGGAESSLGHPIADEAGGRQELQGGALVLSSGRWTAVPTAQPPRSGAGFGIDLGGRTDADAGLLDFLVASGTPWVRINFVRRSSAADWFRDYDRIVDALLGRGIKIYGLINTEAVDRDGSPLARPGDGAARDYAEAFALESERIASHFQGRIDVYELVNEPNNWNEDRVARVHASWMALMLQRAYERVRLDRGLEVTLVMGAVLSFTNVYSTDYIAQVIDSGRRDHGWDVVRARCGRFPFDGVGYHIYVLEDAADRPDQVAGVYARHLDAVEDALRARDPEAGQKKVWLSEFGWRSGHGEDHQADMLEAGFAALGADPRVALAVYFCLQDFVIPTAEGAQLEDWGLLRVDGSVKTATLDRFRRVMGR